MELFLKALIPFLAILNPFALCLYLLHPMEDLRPREFSRVLIGACVVSLAVFTLFAWLGEPVLVNWLGVRPGALRAFGGVLFSIVAYNYVVKGYRGTEILRGSIESMPSAIALPFMIGAGTITQSILIGKRHAMGFSFLVLAVGLLVSFSIVMCFKFIRDRIHGKRERVFDRYVNILARINGLIIGAISAEMIVQGVHEMWN